jgi:hypothetical protein
MISNVGSSPGFGRTFNSLRWPLDEIHRHGRKDSILAHLEGDSTMSSIYIL